ncbi:serine-rich adhesin for platelets-like isoform X2 [Anopheles darlingi]|uniref:serine-rich adhesin for platelets-like isoform X2 n=1 Tax=Anopheles darlingi TaxID=43151 RepID=UPI0021000254|nr:serine-rich adhesin for platelets-like isoform X2 [Anopheles darlingi]
MYGDGRLRRNRSFGVFGETKRTTNACAMLPSETSEKCFPYSILSKAQQQQQQQHQQRMGVRVGETGPMKPALAGGMLSSGSSSTTSYEVPLVNGATAAAVAAAGPGAFYSNAMVTDVGICFSMSNVNLNGTEYHTPATLVPPTVASVAKAQPLIPLAPPLSVAPSRRSPERHHRRKSYEDPGPGTALMLSRRRAAAFVPVSAGAVFKPIVHLPQPAPPPPAPPILPKLHTAIEPNVVALASAQNQQLLHQQPVASSYHHASYPTSALLNHGRTQHHHPLPPVHYPLPRPHRSMLPVSVAPHYGGHHARSPSCDALPRVPAVGVATGGGGAGVSPLICAGATSSSSSSSRSPPPYCYKQSNGGSSTKAAANYEPYPPPPLVLASLQRSSTAAHQNQLQPVAVPVTAQPAQPSLTYFPLPSGTGTGAAIAGQPNGAAIDAFEYYRLTVDAATSDAVMPAAKCTKTITDGLDPGLPPVRYNGGVRKLVLKCCYDEVRHLPTVTALGCHGPPQHPVAADGGTPSTGISTTSPVARSTPGDARRASSTSSTSSSSSGEYGHPAMVVSRSCPASPNAPTLALVTKPDEVTLSTCSSPMINIVQEQQQQRNDEAPMEVCNDDNFGDPVEKGEAAMDKMADDEPKDFSMKPLHAKTGRASVRAQVLELDRNRRELKTAPKKKWIRHYMEDEPLVNGHSTAPPLVVISSNGGGSLMGGAVLQKHGSVNHVSTVATTSIASTTSSPMTIDLSTKHQPNMVSFHHHHTVAHPSVAPSTTPPSSALSSSSSTSSSSSSSTLTVSPVDVDSQSSLSLSNSGSIPNGYVTTHSNNNSSSSNSSSNSNSANINNAGNLSSLVGTLSPLTATTGTVVTNGVPATAGALPMGLNGVAVAVATASSVSGSNNTVPGHHHPGLHHLPIELQQQVAAGLSAHGSQTAGAALFANIPARRRTTSSNSNGVGTREVHNKLEKNRRAHLKECFEQLKKQLSLQPDEKKISNLSILHAAIRHIQVLKRKEREFEHEMERLAKEKIAAQNRILLLKREITQMGDVDVSRLAPDTDMIPNPTTNGGSAGVVASGLNLVGTTVQSDRDQSSETVLVPGRNGIRYSSSSSLSSIATNASISTLPHQTTISPVLSISSPTRGSPALNRNSTSPPSSSSSSSLSSAASSLSVSSVSAASLMVPLSLTTKGGNVLEAHNISSTAPSTLKFSTGPLNGLNLSNSTTALTVNGATVMNGTTGSTTTAQLPVIVGANGTPNIVGITHSQLLATTAAGVNGSTAIQTIPLNLNVTSTTNVCNGINGSGGLPAAAIISSATGLHLASSSAQALQLTTTSGANNSSSNGTSNSIGTTGGITVSSGNSINGTFATASAKNSASVYSTMPGVSVGNLMGMTGKELINGTINGKNGTVRTDTSKLEIIATQSPTNNATVVAANGTTGALDPPGTKVITYALTSVDKDSKMGVVYSPIQLLTQQGLRVIQQSQNGLATIELSAPSNVGNRLQLHLTH